MGEALGDRSPRAVRREIVEHGGIELLVRTSGPPDGDPWLFLHGAGETSRAFVPIATALGRRGRRVLVPDIPGCGQSEALAADAPTIDDYAAVIGGVLDAAPDRLWSVYGRHFGARVAIALATHRPDRIASIVLDGIGRYTRQERDRMRRHVAPLVVPDTDGAYLVTAFQRVRDYALFFPWFDRTAGARPGRSGRFPECRACLALSGFRSEVPVVAAGIRGAYRAALDFIRPTATSRRFGADRWWSAGGPATNISPTPLPCASGEAASEDLVAVSICRTGRGKYAAEGNFAAEGVRSWLFAGTTLARPEPPLDGSNQQ